MKDVLTERRQPERSWFGVDLRSLALFRAGLGLVVLADLLIRWSELGAFYSTSGVLPPHAVASPPAQFRLFLLAGSDAVTHCLFGLLLASAVALTVGASARLAALCCWLLKVSLDCRNPTVLNSGDQLLTLLLLWAAFLPLGARWSLDARRRPSGEPSVHLSPAALGLHLQVVFLYLTAAMHKLRYSSWRDGLHLADTLDRLDYVRPFGRWFGDAFPGLLQPLTWAVLGVQLVFSVLLLMPSSWWRLRVLAVAAFAALQLGMGTMLHVGLFTWVSIVAPLGLLPPGLWDWAARWWPSLSTLPEAPLAADSGLQRACRRAREGLGLALVLLLVLLNLNGHGALAGSTELLSGLARELHMKQDWRMFSSPQYKRSWFAVEATLSSGARIDLLREGQAVSHERPTGVWSGFYGHHWREIFIKHIQREDMAVLRESYLRWEARRWRERHPREAVESLDLVGLSYSVLLPQVPTKAKVLASVKL